MSDAVLPKEKIQNYKPYEMPEFSMAGIGSPSQSSSFLRQNSARRQDIILPTAAQLQDIQNQARDEGYQTAYAEGSQRMAALLDSLQKSLQQVDENIVQDLLNMSLEIARQMTRLIIKENPETLFNIIREAIASLPHFTQGARLLLHPEDAARVREGMGEQLAHSGWKIHEDISLTPGGVLLETIHSQIDATLENRWQRIVAVIGQDSSWIQK